jgi:pimeloyl-ACP methyl ester carboxylesterase
MREVAIDLPGAVTLPCVEQGDPHGIPVLLLHGYSDSWRSYESVLPHLPASIRAIAPSLRGHGGASRPRAGYRFGDFASDMAALLDALGIPSAFVVGHSMGSGVAQRFALDHPGRTRGLVLNGTFRDLRCNPAVRELWDDAIAKLEDPVDPAFVRAFQLSTLAQPIPDDFLERAIAESLRLPARVWRETAEGFLVDDLADHVGAISAPTLVVWGARDALCTRSDQDALLAALPHARLATYAAAGHALHWEEPERFARDVTRFVAAGASAS